MKFITNKTFCKIDSFLCKFIFSNKNILQNEGLLEENVHTNNYKHLFKNIDFSKLEKKSINIKINDILKSNNNNAFS